MTVPDSTELPALIRNAFDALPGPDEQRLASIQQRLPVQQSQRPTSRQPHRLKWILWLVLLGGGTVAAAWWLGETRDENQQTGKPVMKQLTPGESSLPDKRQNAGPEEKENKSERPSPIIYQRGH